MAKKTIKIYLESKDQESLKRKAEALGYLGRGSITRYIEKISREPIVFLDQNLKDLLKILPLGLK